MSGNSPDLDEKSHFEGSPWGELESPSSLKGSKATSLDKKGGVRKSKKKKKGKRKIPNYPEEGNRLLSMRDFEDKIAAQYFNEDP